MVAGTFGAVHTAEAFLARWRYCALTDPRAALANLMYLGYEGEDPQAGMCFDHMYHVIP
jgi:Ras family protein T1